MPDRYLISVTTPDYVKQTGRYFNSLALIQSAQPVVILLDFNEQTDPDRKIEQILRADVDWPVYRHMALPASHSNFMVQHNFLDALPELSDDALICLSDMDISIQRDLSENEWTWIDNVTSEGLLCAYHNAGAWDNLKLEGERISLSDEWVALNCHDHNVSRVPCYNAGLMFGRASVFRRLKGHYERLCASFYEHTVHRSRCQWLINWCVHEFMGGFVTLPAPVHLHAHFRDDDGAIRFPVGTSIRRKVLCWEGVPVAFCHAMPEEFYK